jgi:hypothetical protein
MAQKLGQLKDAMGDVAQETNNLGDDMGKLKGASEGISALVGGFGMINSAIGIGTSEGKLYNAVMRNLQITLTALASLTALQTALQKESALMTLVNTLREKARARAVIASTAATGKATIAQRLFNIVANANPYVLLLTGLTTLITLLVAFSANANTSAESQKRLNEQQKRFLDLLKEENEEARKVADQRKKVIEDEIRAMEAGGAKEDEIAAKRAEIREIERKAIEEEKERLSWEISAYDRNVDAINKLKTAHRGLSDTEERNQKIKRNLGDETKAVITGVYKYADALELVENRMETLKSATEQVEAVLERERAFNAQNRVDDAKQLAAQKEADAKATAEALKAREERSNKERELVRKAEDSAIALLEEGLEKQRKALKKGYARQVEDLQRQLTNDATKLTPAAKAAIEQLIRDLRAAEAKEMARLDGNELRRTIKVEEERIALKLEGVKKGADQEYQLRQQLLIQQERDEIAANRQRVESEQMDEADIRAKYRLLLDENDKARVLEGIERTKEAASLEWEGKLAAVRAGSEEEARIRVEMAQAAADRVRSLSGEQAIAEFGSIQAWKSAVIQADGEVNTSKQALQETIQETTQKQLDAASTVGGAMQELAESFAEDNAAMAGFAKALALFNIGLDTAKAIAAIPAMSAAGDPYTYALRVATAIATVMTSIAKARQVLSKEKEPKAPKFAEGGLVTGPGTGSSDSVPAMLSAGESVITAPATRLFAPLLSAINQVGGGVPISTRQVADQVHGEEMLARAFERALSRMPSPVVSVREITRVSNEVQVLENDAML